MRRGKGRLADAPALTALGNGSFEKEKDASLEDSGVQAFMAQSPSVTDLYQMATERAMLDALNARSRAESAPQPSEAAAPSALFSLALPLVKEGFSVMIDDSFTRCFKSAKKVAWNWNVYLFPAWAAGVAVRYCILFPVRLLALALGFLVVAVCFPVVKVLGLFVNLHAWETLCVVAGSCLCYA